MTGSRKWRNRRQLEAALDQFDSDYHIDAIIHGGAPGADRMADRWAFRKGIRRIVLRPDYNRYPYHVAPLIRNDAIVARSDWMMAFRAPGVSKGTDYTIMATLRAKKLLIPINEEE